ncbi:hypothetical protein BBJ29_000934 [Phytophthora kernoviae]|uniref:START domain-containing protein n=1 Tax=Phytophthora kernoviae TaxID=325452 RepID=A0A3F2RXE3_9STRA|nr:hypothetical protein BBJ29_000934 [Phytophthora kernoviae]RLN66075.1 hypothetical protein BBP00_00002441 [Phytophthora kernoviae]
MTNRMISSSTLPHLRFTKEDVQYYRGISDDCLAEVLRKYEDYVYRDRRHIDSRRWKTVKAREKAVVYRERTASDADLNTGNGDVGLSSSSGSSSGAYHSRHDPSTAVETLDTTTVLGPGAALAAGTKIPVMICTATMPGNLEDAMYGSYVDDTASFRRRSSYEQDLANDIGMLGTFDRPSSEDPFQFLGVTWILRSFPGLGAVIKRRDFLLLQRIGLSTTSQGERIGFTITQSVPHRDLPELKQYDIIRGKMSMCTIYRQMGGQVDVFVQIVMQPGGNGLKYFMIQETATSIMMFSTAGSFCQICKQRVCSKCSVTKKLVIDATETTVVIRPFNFCIGCTLTARSYSALQVHVEELSQHIHA